MQAGARAIDEGHLDALVEAGARRVQDPRGQRRLPGAHRPRPALRRRARPDGQPAHGRAPRERRARGHGRGDRRPDGPRVPRGGHGRRPRAGPAGPRPRAVDPVLVDHADAPVRRPHRRRARPDDGAQPRAVVGDARATSQLVRERILEARMAAEGPLHELGAIAIVNSDSQGMGRIGETVRRTFQLAHVMKAWRRSEAADGRRRACRDDPGLADPDDRDDTARVLRYLAKVDDRAGDHPRHRRPRRVAPARAGSRTSCCGSPGSSASSRSGCSRAGSRPGARWARATRRSSAPSRPATGADWAGVADRGAEGLGDVRLARLSDAARRSRGAWGRGGRCVPVGGVRGLTRGSLARQPRDAAGRHRRPDGSRVARRADGWPSTPVDRGPAQPPLPAALAPSARRRQAVPELCGRRSPAAMAASTRATRLTARTRSRRVLERVRLDDRGSTPGTSNRNVAIGALRRSISRYSP